MRRLRVLVADDHGLMVEAVRLALADRPEFEIVGVADSGSQVMPVVERTAPDLVLLDLRMPRLDGFGAARAITGAFPGNAPKIIGVSASAFEPDREACRQAGCAEFLAKPFREEQLFAALERHLGLKWCYADAATRETSSPFPSVQHAPAAADAESLFELASKGDVVGVRALAQKLAERDPRLAPFAQGVTELAARFKMKAIRQFVDRYRGKPGS
jgi:CheY-like chemotaxis protein